MQTRPVSIALLLLALPACSRTEVDAFSREGERLPITTPGCPPGPLEITEGESVELGFGITRWGAMETVSFPDVVTLTFDPPTIEAVKTSMEVCPYYSGDVCVTVWELRGLRAGDTVVTATVTGTPDWLVPAVDASRVIRVKAH